MKAIYSVPISISEARDFLTLGVSETARIPWGSKCVWVAGVRNMTDQPGMYLIAGIGGLEGIIVYPPAVEQVGEVAS